MMRQGRPQEQGRGAEVIRIADRRIPERPPALAAVEAHWLDLAAGRIMPARAQLDPRRLRPVLDRIFLLERRHGDAARLRVAGDGVTRLSTADLRRRPLADLFAPDERERLTAAADTVFDEPARILLEVAADRVPGQMLILPLRDDTGASSRAIGALEFARALHTPAPGLQITRRHHRTLLGYGHLPRSGDAPVQRRALTLVTGSDRAG
ncbi:MAG: PAS domain-containing protein [Tranquillimonas sp.]